MYRLYTAFGIHFPSGDQHSELWSVVRLEGLEQLAGARLPELYDLVAAGSSESGKNRATRQPRATTPALRKRHAVCLPDADPKAGRSVVASGGDELAVARQ